MSESNIQSADDRYVLRIECQTIRQAVDSQFEFMERRLEKMDNRLWGLMLLAIAQLIGIALTLFKMVVN